MSKRENLNIQEFIDNPPFTEDYIQQYLKGHLIKGEPHTVQVLIDGYIWKTGKGKVAWQTLGRAKCALRVCYSKLFIDYLIATGRLIFKEYK